MPIKLRVLGVLIVTFILFFDPVEISSQDLDTTFCALHHFGAPKSNDPVWPLQPGVIALAPDGSVWTTISQGGVHGVGAVVKVTLEGKFSKVADFDAGTTGASPQGLVYGNNGYMYGAAYGGGKWGAGTIFRISVQGGDPEVIYDFRNGRPTGLQPKDCTTPKNCAYSPQQWADMSAALPLSGPVLVGDTLYGVTPYFNAAIYGTLYSIPRDTAPRSNSFTAASPEDGDEKFHVFCQFQPGAKLACNTKGVGAAFLIAGHDGNLYGTTSGGYGSVFKATTGGAVTSLHEFNNKDGSRPFSIMQASDRNLYGTTWAGGSINSGVLYRIDPRTNTFSIVTDFPRPANNEYVQGFHPIAGVVEGADHNLYGALADGGQYGRGLIYYIALDGSNYGILHDFDFYLNGRKPLTLPMIIGDTIYGTTYQGGLYDSGVLYRIRINRVSVNEGIAIKFDEMIDVRRDAMATQDAKSNDPDKHKEHGIAVRVKCDQDPHFVQFIYREVIQPYPANPIAPGNEFFPNGKLLDNLALEPVCCQTSWGDFYRVTSLLTDIQWNPDAPKKPSPFFEAGHSAELDCDSLTLFDRPEVRAAYLATNNRVARAVARDYAMCGGQVKKEITWISDQTMDQQQNPHWTYPQATIKNVTTIPDYFLCLLKNKGYDLPPGQTITPGVDCAQLGKAVVGKP